MNKQEAIEQLEWNVVRTTDFDRAEDVVVFEKVKSIIPKSTNRRRLWCRSLSLIVSNIAKIKKGMDCSVQWITAMNTMILANG
ncbi:Uncharacterised protein [Streptococcus suis]|uniref:Uncharacterized protein n=1 Tax=Streptococcus suis TaxID=1307 RepID=A0A123U809_STRSU|nr:Uncharacterised protein [Streptococcus suis]